MDKHVTTKRPLGSLSALGTVVATPDLGLLNEARESANRSDLLYPLTNWNQKPRTNDVYGRERRVSFQAQERLSLSRLTPDNYKDSCMSELATLILVFSLSLTESLTHLPASRWAVHRMTPENVSSSNNLKSSVARNIASAYR